MKKNILAGIAIMTFVIMLGFTLFMMGGTKNPERAPLNKSADLDQILYQKDEAELESFDEELALSSQDAVLFSESDQTFDDILDVKEYALDENSISKEAADADLSGELNASVSDDAVLKEADQALIEVTQ